MAPDCDNCAGMREDIKAMQAMHRTTLEQLIKSQARIAALKNKLNPRIPPIFRQPTQGRANAVDVSLANGSALYRVCSVSGAREVSSLDGSRTKNTIPGMVPRPTSAIR